MMSPEVKPITTSRWSEPRVKRLTSWQVGEALEKMTRDKGSLG